MRMRTAMLGGLLALTASAGALADPAKKPSAVPIAIGQMLPIADAKLLKAGWKPIRWQKKGDDPEWSANAQVFFDAGFVGVEDCAGTGNNPCLFRYKNKQGECLTLSTTGEIPKEAPVTYWDFSCPDASSK